MADRDYYIKKLKDLYSEMSNDCIAKLKVQFKELFAKCPDIGLIHFTSYTSNSYDYYDSPWGIRYISTFLKRHSKIGNIGNYSIGAVLNSSLPESIKILYCSTPSNQLEWETKARYEAKLLGIPQNTIENINKQDGLITSFLNIIEKDIKFFVPENSQWLIANHNGEVFIDVKSYKPYD